MPQLEVQGYVTPEQQYAGLYKLGETIATQQAARQKAQAEKDANKKLLNSVVAKIDPKDFISNTIIDGKTSQDVYTLLGEAASAIKANPDMSQNDLEMSLLPGVSLLAKRVQNAKEVKRQLDKGAEEMKGVAGFDVGKYYKLGNNYFLNLDGSVREDIENIDVSQNFYQKILENGDVWNQDAIHSILKEVPTISDTKSFDVRDIKGNRRKTTQELTYNPTFYQPKFNGTDFEGFQPETENALDDKGQVVVDANKNEIPILGHNSYAFLMSKPQSMAYINQRKRQIAQENNLDPNSVQVENAVRAELHDLVGNSPYRKASSKEIQQQQAPVVKNYMGGSGGSKEPTINDVYDRLFAFTNRKLDEYKEKNMGDTNPKTGKFKIRDYVQVNLLDTDLMDVVLKTARKATGEQDLGTEGIKIRLDENGTMGIYRAKGDKLIAQLTSQGTNLPSTPKAGGKEKEIKRIPKLSEYGSPDQKRIQKFMSDNNLGEQEAIKVLIEKGIIHK